MVREERLELSRLSARASKTRMATITSLPHCLKINCNTLFTTCQQLNCEIIVYNHP
jgi:hypothetical protein